MTRLVTLIALIVFLAVPAFAVAVDEKPLDDPRLEERARDLMKQFRCLQCQNQSIEDSNADLARDLRALVRERVAAGDSDAEVRAYLVARYGDWVLMKPPLKTSTYFLWASPFFVILIILVLVMRRRQQVPAGPAPLSAEEEAEIRRLTEGDK